MFLHLDEVDAAATTADVIVVGSGPAGLPIVEALLAAGASVLVLETGDVRRPESLDLNEIDTTGMPLPSATAGRVRVFGGTGQDWSGQCLRMEDPDFDHRDWLADSGWPLTGQALSPYYHRAESYFGITGAQYDLSVLLRAGVTPPAFDSDVFRHRNTVYSPKLRVGSETRAQLAREPSARVICAATVAQVTLSTSGNQVSGVRAVNRRGTSVDFRAPVVILACGAIENARLLLLSGSGADGLGNASRHVGRHFQEHPFCSAAVVHAPAESLMATYRATFARGIRHRAKTALALSFQQREEVLAGTIDLDFHYPALSSVAAVKRLDNAWSRRRIGISSGRDITIALRDPIPVARAMYRRLRGRGVEGETPERVLLRVQTEQAPAGESQVSLSLRRDVLGIPMARVDWQVGDLEWRSTQALTAAAGEQFAELGLGRVEAFDWLNDLAGYRAHVTDTYHHAGTTRMAVDAKDGVVDVNCMVHDVGGLYIAGGSVFPTSGYANPTLTVVAMSLRLADHLTASAHPLSSPASGRP